MATPGRGKVDASVEGHAARFGCKVVRCAWGSLESFSNGLLSIIYAGKRQKLPEIKNPLLLESATNLAAKIRRGEVNKACMPSEKLDIGFIITFPSGNHFLPDAKPVKSSDVIEAYIQRIQEINPIVNAVVDDQFKEALEDARRVDQLVESGVKTEKEMEMETPFLGVPFSSKEAIPIKGLSFTSGLVSRKGWVAQQDCAAVSLLRKSGAIPLVVTNTSEICMWWETYNKLHGKTNNPHDTRRTVGGSSGGEAALIASAGSIMGIGNDLGGSIRIPSYFAGIFGHKPSRGLVPYGGQFPPPSEQVSPYVATGPMVRYASDLRNVLRVLIKDLSPELQLNTRVDLRSIRVFYMIDDCNPPTCCSLSPEIQDTILEVINWLKSEGVHCKAVRLNKLKHGVLIWCASLAEVKDQKINNLMSGHVKKEQEPNPPHQEMWKWLSGRSDHTFPVILNACFQEFVAPAVKNQLKTFKEMNLKLRTEMDDMLGSDGVFLFPTYPTTAPYHGQIIVNPMNVSYSVIFNAIGLPVTQCPLGVDSTGLPMGFQVVTGHNNDRLSLTLAEELEKKFGGWRDPSQTLLCQE